MSVFIFPPTVATVDTGALATAANQLLILTELQDINTELDSQTGLLTSLDGKDFATEATLATVAGKDFATEATLATVAGKDFATEATLAALAAEDFATEATLAALSAKLPATLGTQLIAASLAVNIASDQVVPVSASSLPLPTGAATEATLSTVAGKDFSTEATLAALSAKLPATLGTQLIAASLAVNIASDQVVPVSASSLPLPTGAATEATLSTIAGKDFATEATLAALSAKLPATLGAQLIAASLAVNIASDQVVPVSASSLPLPTGAATEAKQDSVVTELQAIKANLNLDVVDQIDTTPLLDTSSTNIPASSGNPQEVVASTAAIVKKIIVVEDIGSFIGLYTGAALSEVLKAVLPLGGGEVELNIAAGTRISLRAMENTAISSGKIAINFLG